SRGIRLASLAADKDRRPSHPGRDAGPAAMTEPPAPTPPEPQSETPPEAVEELPLPPPTPSPRRNLVPWVYALGFVVLAMALLWMWRNPNPEQVVRPQRVQGVEEQIRELTDRLNQMPEPKAAATPDLRPLEQRVAALEARPPVQAPNLQPIEQQITALKAQLAARPASGAAAPDLSPIEARLAALDKQVRELTPLGQQMAALQSDLGGRVTQLAADEANMAKQVQELHAAVASQDSGLAGRLAGLQRQADTAVAAASKAARLARVQTARAALAAGEPLGSVPDAPPELARFADARPPTEAALRLAFPSAADAALAASRPDTQGKPFGERLWQRAQGLVTVREGDRVIVGDPSAGILADARTHLEAGDLAGAVAAVSTLTGSAAQAMATWLAQAKSVLAARTALDQMAAGA
ncbi:MAG TPA: mitofilin family membrane protein, partial [Acetobacteraceae bacterium]